MTPNAEYLQQLLDAGLPRWVAPGPELDRIRVADAFGWVVVSYGVRVDGRDTFGREGDGLVRDLTPAGRRLLALHQARNAQGPG